MKWKTNFWFKNINFLGGQNGSQMFDRIIEYSELEGNHKDHQAQLSSEWPIQAHQTLSLSLDRVSLEPCSKQKT